MDADIVMSAADPTRIELRGDVSRDITDVLDAVARSRRCSRMDVVEEVLSEWMARKIHESTLVLRLARRDGNKTER